MSDTLTYSQLNPSTVVWGVASVAGGGRFVVRAYRDKLDAEAAATRAPWIKIPQVRSSVRPLVYYHPDGGWTLAAVGHSIRTV